MQKNPLAAKVALITGAARRIGAEVARTLHEAGMHIVLHYNSSEEDALKLSLELNQKRDQSAVALRANLQEPESELELIKQTVSVWKRLDVVVNNASRFYQTSFGEVTNYAWDDLLSSNLKSPFFLSQAAAPHLAEQNGCIVNITDIHAERPMHDYSVYCISKGGLLVMTKVLAKELGPKIRVNGVAPGAILWPEGSNELSTEDKQKIIKRTALARPGQPKDIAKTVLFLVRDAEYITGQVISVDGGRMLFG